MENSKLLQALRQLSTKERTRFQEYLYSPYFNKNEDRRSFYDYLLKFAPTFRHKNLNKNTIYPQVFPERSNDTRHLGYIMSDLLKLLENFLAQERFNANTILSSYYTAYSYSFWGLDKHYRSVIRKAKKRQQQSPHRDTDFFYKEYLIAAVANEFFAKQRKHKYDETLQQAVDNLDLFYLAQKLKYCCEIINRQKVLSADYELKMFNELLEYLEEHPHKDKPAISIYHHILLMLLEEEGDTYYKKLIYLLDQNSHLFPEDEAADMYGYAQNFCIQKINKGNTEYLQRLFDLYKTVLDKELIFVDGYLSPWTYKNILVVALRLKAFDWAEQFIENFKDQLAPKFRENAYTFNKANLLYHKKQYDEALALLLNVDFTDIYYQLNTKFLMIKIYYDTNAINALHSLINSFQAFLRRNKLVSDYREKANLNFLKYLRKLLNIRSGDKKELKQLAQEVQSVKSIDHLEWLLEKIEEKKEAAPLNQR